MRISCKSCLIFCFTFSTEGKCPSMAAYCLIREMCTTLCAPLSGVLGSCSVGLHSCVDYKSTMRHVLYSQCRADVCFASTAFSWRQAASHQCPGIKFPMCLAVELGRSAVHRSHSVHVKDCTKQNFYSNTCFESRCPPGTPLTRRCFTLRQHLTPSCLTIRR